jgi:hypothetical protein
MLLEPGYVCLHSICGSFCLPTVWPLADCFTALWPFSRGVTVKLTSYCDDWMRGTLKVTQTNQWHELCTMALCKVFALKGKGSSSVPLQTQYALPPSYTLIGKTIYVIKLYSYTCEIHSHSFKKCLLSLYYVSITVFGTGGTWVSEPDTNSCP